MLVNDTISGRGLAQSSEDDVRRQRMMNAGVPNGGDPGGGFGGPATALVRLNFNIQYQNRNSKTQQLFGYRDTSTGYGNSASVGWSHSFAPRTNSATVSFSRNVAMLALFRRSSQCHIFHSRQRLDI
ncbi:MAG TPA: hypothetical protein VFA65_02500 [Bryobacteraceae bacterium]|nr:hypothetical protein [Bryobacteraceae bacterium]